MVSFCKKRKCCFGYAQGFGPNEIRELTWELVQRFASAFVHAGCLKPSNRLRLSSTTLWVWPDIWLFLLSLSLFWRPTRLRLFLPISLALSLSTVLYCYVTLEVIWLAWIRILILMKSLKMMVTRLKLAHRKEKAFLLHVLHYTRKGEEVAAQLFESFLYCLIN